MASMRIRLRLCIHRNDLPAVKTLWPIAATQIHHTIAQLLESVNQVFPLESDTWGLEHYTVTVGDYECLHWHQIGSVCKDEDEVTIRPLQYAEVRTRTVLGRDQITSDGRHIFDGLPFGRPFLKGTIRPHLSIPPRKRRKLDTPEQDGGDEESEPKLYLEWNGESDTLDDLPIDDELNPSPVTSEEEEDSDYQESLSDDEDIIGNAHESSSGTTSDEYIELSGSTDSTSGHSSDDSSDSSSEVRSDSSSDVSSDSSSESSSDSSSDESSQDEDNKEAADTECNGVHKGSTPANNKRIVGNQLSGREVPSNAAQNALSTKATLIQPFRQPVIPGEGSPFTQLRNRRRSASKRLMRLKAMGELPPNASLADLREREGSDSGTRRSIDPANVKPSDRSIVSKHSDEAKADMERRREHLLRALESGGVDITAAESERNSRAHAPSRESDRLEDADEGPEERSSKLASNINDNEGGPARKSQESTSTDPLAVLSADIMKTATMVPSSVLRRSKLDLAGSRRMLFGSLGMRVPSSVQDKHDLQKKLADRVGRNDQVDAASNKTRPAEKAVPSEIINCNGDDASADAWKDKIILSAVECCEEGVNLSEPSFPFYQRWDPQQRHKKHKKRKRARLTDSYEDGDRSFVETYDKYNQDGTGDALEYDDVNVSDGDYWEEGALLGDDPLEGLAEDEDFPSVPVNHASLPPLAEEDARVGNFIVYEEMTCSAATSWQPTYVTRTALLESKHDETQEWTIVLAARDMPVREYDEEGNRVYSKFEMQGFDEDGNEDHINEDGSVDSRRRVLQWSELQNPRLLPHNTGL